MLNVLSKVNWKMVKTIGGYAIAGGMAVAEAIEKNHQAKTVAKLTKEVAELKTKMK